MFKKILAPITHTKSSRRMREVACDMAKSLDASIHYITVHVDGTSEKEKEEEMLKKVADSCTKEGITVTYELVELASTKDIVPLLADMSKDYDLIVMGHCRYNKLYKFLHESAAEELIKISNCPVTVVSSDCESR